MMQVPVHRIDGWENWNQACWSTKLERVTISRNKSSFMHHSLLQMYIIFGYFVISLDINVCSCNGIMSMAKLMFPGPGQTCAQASADSRCFILWTGIISRMPLAHYSESREAPYASKAFRQGRMRKINKCSQQYNNRTDSTREASIHAHRSFIFGSHSISLIGIGSWLDLVCW